MNEVFYNNTKENDNHYQNDLLNDTQRGREITIGEKKVKE